MYPSHHLIVVEVWMNPIEIPHLHKAEKDRIISLINSAKPDMFIYSNREPPQNIIIVTLYESIIPLLLKIRVHSQWEDHSMKDLQERIISLHKLQR